MHVAKVRKAAILLAILALFSAPSWAGSFGAYGAYWDTKDADASWGAGIRVGFNLTKIIELEFRGTYFPDFKNDEFSGQTIEVTAIPVDGGLKFNFLPSHTVNPYVGGGVSYYFLSINPGSVDDQTGVYLDAGLDVGDKDGAKFFAEILWRKVDTSVSFGSFDNDVAFDGISLNAGVTWRWGT